jgi:hypothetical protein
MGKYVSRRIKYYFNQAIISVYQQQQGTNLTTINSSTLKSHLWKLLSTLLLTMLLLLHK